MDIDVKKEPSDTTDCAELPDDEENCATCDVKTEDIDNHEQLICGNGVQESIPWMVESENADLDGLSRPTYEDLVIGTQKQGVTVDPDIYKFKTFDYGFASKEGLDKQFDVPPEQDHFKYYLYDYMTHKEGSVKPDSADINSKQHRCYLCEFSTNYKQNLKTHVESVHLNLRQNKCEFCDFTTNHKQNLKKHVDSVHLNLKRHVCNWCDFSSNHIHRVKEHSYYVHLNLKQHKCNLCDFSTNQRYHLKGHIDSVHLNLKHKCYFCEFTTNHKNYLKGHIDSVHLNLKQHKCDFCNYATNQKCNLKSHIDSVHLNLKQHKCNLCDYAANQKITLKRHLDSMHLNPKRPEGHNSKMGTRSNPSTELKVDT